MCTGPDLIDDDAQHEYQVDAERPEQDSFGAGEVAAGAVVEDFGGGELVRFEGGDDYGNVFARGMCGGIEFLVHLRDHLGG